MTRIAGVEWWHGCCLEEAGGSVLNTNITQAPSRETTRPEVSLRLSKHGGWDIHVQLEGQTFAVEHHEDWHRVEHRRAWLEQQLSAAVTGRGLRRF